MWTVEFRQCALVQYRDLVEINDGLKFVRHGDDGVFAEFLADDSLNEGIGMVIDTGGERKDESD